MAARFQWCAAVIRGGRATAKAPPRSFLSNVTRGLANRLHFTHAIKPPNWMALAPCPIMCSPNFAPDALSSADAQQPQNATTDDAHLQQIENLLVERLMTPTSSSLPGAPPQQPSQLKRETKRKTKRKKERRRPDERIEAFRDSVAQKAKIAQKAVLAIATVRPLPKSVVPPVTKPPTHTSTTSVPTIKVKQLPTASPSELNASKSDQKSSQQLLVDAARFVDTHRTEIGDFGSQALHRRDRKKYEAAKRIKLGCRPPKNQKMPIGLLQRHRKRQKINAQRQKERNLATGMLLRTKRR